MRHNSVQAPRVYKITKMKTCYDGVCKIVLPLNGTKCEFIVKEDERSLLDEKTRGLI